MKFLTVFVLLAVFAVPVEAAGPPTEVVKLRRQVKTLKQERAKLTRQVKALQSRNEDLRVEVAGLEGQLRTAQQGVPGAIMSMEHSQIWDSALTTAASKFTEPKWSVSYYVNGDYRAYTFTNCGFC